MTIENAPQPVIEETPTKKGFSILALVSLLTGILSYFLVFFFKLIHLNGVLALVLAPISALAAIITGHKSRRQIKRSDIQLSGKKLANTGLILGYVFLVLGIIIIVVAVLIAGSFISGVSHIFG
jgi:Ca2+/Na+ antiporter